MRLSLLTSSIGKKVGMALTGLAIYLFLLDHLVGNFLLFNADAGEQFNAYSKFLTDHPLLVPIELILLGLLLLHVYFGISVTRENRRARPVRYQKTRAVGRRSLASRSMILSGILIVVFVILHLKTFKYGDLGDGTLYDLVMDTFANPLYVGRYVFSMIVLGFHLWHSFQSAFQTLGFRTHRKFWTASMLISVVLSGGFAVIPLWAFLR